MGQPQSNTEIRLHQINENVSGQSNSDSHIKSVEEQTVNTVKMSESFRSSKKSIRMHKVIKLGTGGDNQDHV